MQKSIIRLSSLIFIAVSMLFNSACDTSPLEVSPDLTITPPASHIESTLSTLNVTVNLNVRAGPGTNYPRIGQLSPGSSVEIMGKNPDESWWQITFDTGLDQTGWVSASSDYGQAVNTDSIPVVSIPPTPANPPTTINQPTATPTVPGPPSGKSILVLSTGGVAGEFLIQNQKYPADGQQIISVTLEPGPQDVVFVYHSDAIQDPRSNELERAMILDWVFKLDLIADSICELNITSENGLNRNQDGFICRNARN